MFIESGPVAAGRRDLSKASWDAKASPKRRRSYNGTAPGGYFDPFIIPSTSSAPSS
jgi:hypothetical protein